MILQDEIVPKAFFRTLEAFLEFGNADTNEAQRARGHLGWLGERERLVFANTMSVGLASSALQNWSEACLLQSTSSTMEPADVQRR